jgi:hypothetical protein
MGRNFATRISIILATATVVGTAWGASPTPGQQPPVNIAPPSVSGTAQVGSTLTGGSGSWSGKALKYAYQWLRCNSGGGSCGPIGGASVSSYAPVTVDVGSTLRVAVTAWNKNGSAVATSAATGAVASAPSPVPAPATPPSDDSLPTVSGVAQQGQTLTGSAGSWSGTSPLSYAYQWQRCGSGGGSCAPISGATGTSYVLGSTDVGSTTRLAVTATNSAGSATASSDATAVVTATSTTSSASPYWVEHLDGSYTQSFWYESGTSGGGSTSWVPGYSGQARRITLPGVSSAGSTYGQSLSFASTNAHVAYAGSGSCDSNCNGVKQDTWYRFRLHFASDYKPTPGTQNTLFEFHNDPTTVNDGKAHGGDPYSPWMGVSGNGGGSCSGSPLLCTAWGSGPYYLEFHNAGGNDWTSYGQPGNYDRYFQGPQLQLDHWYDIVAHYVWAADSTGIMQYWVDGTQVVNFSGPTLYLRTNGTWSYATCVGFYDYRLWANWGASVDFDEINVGPTADSIGFAP